MKKLLILLLIVCSYTTYAQSTSSTLYLPDAAGKLSQKGLPSGTSYTTSTANWTSATYNELYAPLSLPTNALYILRLYIEKSGQETTTQLYYVGIQVMQNANANAADLTPFLTFQTSGTTNAALKVRYRKPQAAYQVGTWGVEATVLSNTYAGGTLSYSLTPVIIP